MSYYSLMNFDELKHKQRLELLGLSAVDQASLEALHAEIIQPNLNQIVDDFYDKMQLSSDFRDVLDAGFELDSLRKTQLDYLREFGLGFVYEAYFEQRLRIGLVHLWAGVGLALYVSGFSALQQCLIAYIPDDHPQRLNWTNIIIKIAGLDVSLAIEAFHHAQVKGLSESLDVSRTQSAVLDAQIRQDTLTQVHSRVSLNERLAQSQRSLASVGIPFCVAMLDLDFFKKVNDQYGHLVGDQVLHDVAARVNRTLRNSDVIGRFGGEEFLLILNGIGCDAAAEICERVRQRVCDQPIQSGEHRIQVTVSIGLAEAQKNETDEDLVARTDALLYRAKQNGRNRIEY